MARSLAAMTPGPMRRPVKRLVRRVGVATSELRPLPDFLVIGTHRGGTTSLYNFLNQHPRVARTFPRVQQIKGVRYFDECYGLGPAWYRSHFPTSAYRELLRRLHGEPVLTGEASPYYLFHPAAAERASKLVPEARIVALLRNPIDRGYSHWKRERRDGREPYERFEEAVAAEEERLAGEVERILGDEAYYSYAHENFSYITQGLYLDSLRRWLDYYPRDQVFVEASERFLRDPQRVYDAILEFLGLTPRVLRDVTPRNTTATDAGLDPAVRRALAARLAPHNRALEEYLGMELGWDAPVPGDAVPLLDRAPALKATGS